MRRMGGWSLVAVKGGLSMEGVSSSCEGHQKEKSEFRGVFEWVEQKTSVERA